MADKAQRTRAIARHPVQAAARTPARGSGPTAERTGGALALRAPGDALAGRHNTAALQRLLGQARQGPAVAPPPALRARIEQATGASLAGVRLHTGPASQQAAQALSARAFTIGRDVHFGAAQFNPGRPDGDHLIAHELVHTLQPGPQGLSGQAALDLSRPGDASEREAEHIAGRLLARPAGTGPHGIHGARGGPPPLPVQATRAAITRVDVKNGDAVFRFDPYAESDADSGKNTARKVGVTIDLTYQSAPALRSDKIAFVQTMRTTKGGTPYLFENEKPRATKFWHGGAGWAVDRLAGKNSPNYAQENDGSAGGNTRFGSRTDAAATDAWMHDHIQLNRAVGQTVKVDAVTFALDETHGVYLGGVSWGFTTDAAGKTTKKAPALAAAGKPGGVQKAALKQWNAQAELSDLSKRNAPDQKKAVLP